MQNKFLIAYSGGMDSHVLLHKFVTLRDQNKNIELRAVHVHHGLSLNADFWVEHCQKVCDDLGVTLIVEHVNVRKEKGKHSLEAIARKLRYQVFNKLLTDDEILVTAHHADDQAETVLLQLFRGAGIAGLAAMPEKKDRLLRPLLSSSRQELLQYAKKHNLTWIEDESNEHIGFDRNFIRHKLLPIIAKKWPSHVATINRAAENCGEALELLNDFAQQDFSKTTGSVANTLSISALKKLSTARQNSVIRFWLKALGFAIPSKNKLEHIHTDILNCRIDANPIVSWDGVEIRRYQNNLYAMEPLGAFDINLAIKKLKEAQKLQQYDNDIKLRARKLGESVKVKNRQGTHTLKNIMQEKKIPPWLRDRVILVFQKDVLIDIIF